MQVTAPRGEAPGLRRLPPQSHLLERRSGWCVSLTGLACAGFQVGSFRRTSTTHDHELFTQQWIACRNTQNSVVDVQSAGAEGANTCSDCITRSSVLQGLKRLKR